MPSPPRAEITLIGLSEFVGPLLKKVARHLLARLHELLVLGRRQKIQSRAKIRLEIETLLDEGLPRAYDKELSESKCNTLFEHVYELYQGEGRSAFTAQ